MEEAQVQDQTQPIPNAFPEEFSKYFSDLRVNVQNDDDARMTWKNKLITAANQRLGIKRLSNKPYPGAPNIPLPETDKLIRKQKPNYVMSAYSQKKLCTVEVDTTSGQEQTKPVDQKQLERAELGINFILKRKMDWLKKLAIAVDNFLEKGHCIFKVIEKFESMMKTKTLDLTTYPPNILDELKSGSDEELQAFICNRFGFDYADEDDKETVDDIIAQFRDGETTIIFTYEDVRAFPDVIIPPAEKIIVPAYTTDIGTAERVTHEYFYGKREMEEAALAKRFNPKIVEKLDKLEFKPASKNEYDVVDTQLSRNEGIQENPENDDGLYRIRETVTWYKPEGSKRYERWLFTFMPDVATPEDSLLQMMPFPYDLDTWNYVKHDHESKSWRYHDSRGVPEMIRAVQEFMERSMNNMLIRDDINNAPIYTVLTSSKIQSSSVRFIPGQKLKVAQHSEISRLDDGQSKVDLSSERINQTLKAYAEEYLGSVDQLFRNATNRGGGKTLGEIQQGMQVSQNLLSLDIMLWNETLRQVYTMVFYILRDRLDEPIVVDGVTITKEDFNFVPQITPTGSIDNLDKERMAMKFARRLEYVVAQIQLGLIVTPEDLYNAFRDFMENDGVKDPERYCTKPDEVNKLKQGQAAAEQKVLDEADAQLAGEQDAARARGAGGESKGGEDVSGAGKKTATPVQ